MCALDDLTFSSLLAGRRRGLPENDSLYGLCGSHALPVPLLLFRLLLEVLGGDSKASVPASKLSASPQRFFLPFPCQRPD